MIVNAIYVWTHLQSCHHSFVFRQLSKTKLKEILIFFFFLTGISKKPITSIHKLSIFAEVLRRLLDYFQIFIEF